MRGRYPVILFALVAIFSMACNFSTKLNEQQGAPTVESLVTATARPQTAFIDGRDQPEGSVAQEVASVPSDSGGQAQLVSQSGSGAGGGSYASGGNYGGNSGGSCCNHQYPPSCTPSYNWTFTYVVRPGDTLSRIAQAAGVSLQALAQANCIANPNIIYVGQVLHVPCDLGYLPPPPPPPPCCYNPYPPYPPYPPHPYPTYSPPMYPTPVPPTAAPPVVSPPVVLGSGLDISPYDSVNNNTFLLPPDGLITITWPATFPAATDHVVFELIPPGMGSGSPIGLDSNLGDGASILWNAVSGTQGTLRAVAYFTGGYAPQVSDSYYVIAGYPPTYVPFP
ncbi:MAG: LysM domain-containing protein [Chloroflexota bacterium]